MRTFTNHIHLSFQVLLIATTLCSLFLTFTGFFNDLLTSKLFGLGMACLFVVGYFVVSSLFRKQLKVSAIDVLVLLFAAWYFISELISGSALRPLDHLLFPLLLWGVIYMFVRQASGNMYFILGVAIVWMMVVCAQAILGLMQLYGFEKSFHGLFSITGTFHNPGPFSGFVVSGLPLALGVICYTKIHGDSTEKHRGIYLKWVNIILPYGLIAKYAIQTLAWITLIAILLILPPAQSRAAWIAGIAGSLFVLAGHPRLLAFKENLRNKFLSLKKPIRILLLTAILLPLATAAFGLYTMKQGSADGRLLMWQVTSQLIKERPITGHGAGAFNALYMNEQANWFSSGKGTEAQAMVAGSPEAPFNEPLKLWLEKGLIGILIVGGILYLIFFKKRTNNQKLSTNNIKLQTSNFEPKTSKNLQPYNLSTQNHKLTTINYQPSTPNHQPSTINPELFPILGTSLRYATQNHKLTTINYQPSTPNHQPSTINPELFPILGTSLRYATQNHKLTTINDQPSTQNFELSTAIKGALLTVLTFSLFSYPFDISSFILQLVILVAILAGTTKTLFSIRGGKVLFLTIPVAMLLIAATIHFIPQRQSHYQAMKIWQEADRFYSFGSYHTAVDAYEEAFPALQTTGLFLQMYGKALNMDEQHQKSNEILAMAQQRFSSQIIQNTLGDNHKALGNYPAAEAAYIKSTNMIPSLLLPKYLLAKLYTESGQHHKAKQTAEEILNSPVKVESSATREIINEMRSVINEQ
ncbi:O-antigen ligase family protein [Alkalitalea saponilacus]|uniref:O-antigen ligase n=1 Tax=Alkalitalea saponilacus TaxID=889453 RepID=A0A1T5GD51_9BACT|nr:O-antigen ligase family protein [Alkalitalea saponilacus]ASB47934.1 hypothetical protein CDL62_01595 [Alkalitalea saponilacus]SKC06368.1 O-antigen ligase [Alkalitalea saponilacus]